MIKISDATSIYHLSALERIEVYVENHLIGRLPSFYLDLIQLALAYIKVERMDMNNDKNI